MPFPAVPRLSSLRKDRQVFASLSIPNYRRYFLGQVVSRVGTWMQKFAQSWLVYELSGSATIVGVVVALQAVPMLLAGPYAGLIADRFDKRRIMIGLQWMMAFFALALGVLTVTHVVTLWEIFALALLLGTSEAFENPARQVFVFEIAGHEQLSNAVGLNSALNNIARAVGPALGAGIVAAIGLGTCFLINAVSFLAVIYSLMTIDRTRLQPAHLTSRAKGQLREGLAYVRQSPVLWVPLAMMALMGTLAWEFQTTLPPMASHVLHGGATAYGLMTAAQGVGAIGGGLAVAALRRTGPKLLVMQAIAFGGAMTLLTFSPNLPMAIGFMVIVGFTATSFSATGNTTVQLNTDPRMRGRVMSLWVLAAQGSTPIGGPLTGFVATTAGAREALGLGAASCFAAAGLGAFVAGRRGSRRTDAAPVALTVPAEPDSV